MLKKEGKKKNTVKKLQNIYMKFAEEEEKNRVFFFCKVIVIKVKIKGQ